MEIKNKDREVRVRDRLCGASGPGLSRVRRCRISCNRLRVHSVPTFFLDFLLRLRSHSCKLDGDRRPNWIPSCATRQLRKISHYAAGHLRNCFLALVFTAIRAVPPPPPAPFLWYVFWAHEFWPFFLPAVLLFGGCNCEELVCTLERDWLPNCSVKALSEPGTRYRPGGREISNLFLE